MHVSINQVTTVYYNSRDYSHALLNTTYGDDKPLVYLCGRKQIIASFTTL